MKNTRLKITLYVGAVIAFSVIISVLSIMIGKSGVTVGVHSAQLPLSLNSLSDNNILIESAANKSFDSMFATVKNNISTVTLDNIRKYSVVLVNNSDRPIISYAIKWEFEQHSGKTLVTIKENTVLRSLQVYASTDDGQAAPMVRSNGGTRIISLFDSMSNIDSLTKMNDAQWSQIENVLKKNMEAITNDRIVNCKRWSATLDQVIFTDGVVIGKNNINSFERIKAKMEGRRDEYISLSREIKSMRFSEADYSSFFSKLEENTNKSDIIIARANKTTWYAWREKPTGATRTDFYNKGKLAAIREVLILNDRSGSKKAVDYIHKIAQEPRVHFYRELPNKERVGI